MVIFSIMDHASSCLTNLLLSVTKKTEEAYNLLWGNIVAIVDECCYFYIIFYENNV